MSQRINPGNYTSNAYPGYERWAYGWINCDCEPVIDVEPLSCTSNSLRFYWEGTPLGGTGGVCTTIPCGGFDMWNAPKNFTLPPSNTYIDQANCFQVGEYLIYKCSLTDTEYCSVLEYLHEKWQGDM
jgi:hypothetical protein